MNTVEIYLNELLKFHRFKQIEPSNIIGCSDTLAYVVSVIIHNNYSLDTVMSTMIPYHVTEEDKNMTIDMFNVLNSHGIVEELKKYKNELQISYAMQTLPKYFIVMFLK